MRKSWSKSLSVRTLMLAGFNLSLLALIVQRLLNGTAVHEVLAVGPRKVSVDTMLVAPAHASPALEGVQTKALFHSTRSFYTPPPPAPVKELPPQPNYRLVGAIVAKDKPTTAMLSHNQSKKSVKVRAGDELEGWTIEAVEAKRVIARLGEESFEINATSTATRQSAGMISATPASSGAGVSSGQPGMRPNIPSRALQSGYQRQENMNTPPGGVKVLSGGGPQSSSSPGQISEIESIRTYQPMNR